MSVAPAGRGDDLVVTRPASTDQVPEALALRDVDAHSPLGKLLRDPSRFDFFQAVRLISLAAAGRLSGVTGDTGRSSRFQTTFDEQVRFRAQVGHGFPPGVISSIEFPDGRRAESAESPIPEMTVTFMSLAGTGGILPGHYTQTLIDRVREKDFSLRDFLDLFNHRLISQFWRAWARSHFYVGFELARRDGRGREDLFTQALYSLVGVGTGGLRHRQAVPDELFLYYSGHFACLPRSAVALRLMIADYLRVPVEIRQFQPQWMYIEKADQTRLGGGDRWANNNNQLGVTAIAGSRILGVENKFRIRLGVINYATFCRFLPGGKGFIELSQLTRAYAGSAWDFDLQLVLAREEVPSCRLDRDGGVQLGWNTWLFGEAMSRDADDAVFECDGMPDR